MRWQVLTASWLVPGVVGLGRSGQCVHGPQEHSDDCGHDGVRVEHRTACPHHGSQSPRRGVVGSFLAVSPVVSLLFGIVMLSTVDRVMPFYVLQLGQYFLIAGVCTLFLFVRDRVAAEYSDAALERSMIRQPRADRHRLIADFLLPRGASAPSTGLIIVGAWFLIFASRIGLSAVGFGSGKAAAGQSASDTEAAGAL